MERGNQITFISGVAAVESAVDCLLSVYGSKDNYVDPNMLDADFLAENIHRGRLNVFSGLTESGIAAVTVLVKKSMVFAKSLEVGVLAVRREYRGIGLGSRIITHAAAESEQTASFYAHLVLFTAASGKTLETCGFVPTGFLFGVCRADKHMKQLGFVSQKHTLAIYVKTCAAAVVPTIYVPAQLEDFARDIYASLGANPVIVCGGEQLAAQSTVEYEQDDDQQTLYIYVLECGVDLPERLLDIEGKFEGAYQSTILFLNINDKGAAGTFAALREMGYVFTGFKPLCGYYEFIVMANKRAVITDNTELKLTSALEAVYNKMGEL